MKKDSILKHKQQLENNPKEYYRVFKEVLKDRLYDAYINNDTVLQAIFESQLDLVNRRISELTDVSPKHKMV